MPKVSSSRKSLLKTWIGEDEKIFAIHSDNIVTFVIQRRDSKYQPSWKDVFDKCPPVPSISRGPSTLKIPMSVYFENRERLVADLATVAPHGLVLLQAASQCSTDSPYVQDPFFFWAFGYRRNGIIGAIDVGNKKSYAVVERLSDKDLKWGGRELVTRSQFKNHLLVDGVWYLDELETFLEFMKSHHYCKEVLILADQKQKLPDCINRYYVDNCKLHPVMLNLIARKSQIEFKIIHYVTKILESALIHIIKRFKPSMTSSQVETSFVFFMTHKSGFEQFTFNIYKGSDPPCYRDSGRRRNAPKEERVFEVGDMIMLDVGASYLGYSMTLEVTMPADHKFTSRQALIYDTMLMVHICICRRVKQGTPVDVIRKAAERCLLKILINKHGLLHGTVDGALEAGVGTMLSPYPPVRCPGVGCAVPVDRLELDKVYMIEPGCFLTEEVLCSEVLNHYVTEELLEFAGISAKLSEPVIITRQGFRFFSGFIKARKILTEMRSEDYSLRTYSVIEMEKDNRALCRSLYESLI